MTLTPAQQAALEAPFKPEEHRFDLSGNVYIDKAAIRRRLSQVDPGWSQTSPVVVSQTANTVTLSATLNISGSTRSATGVAIINRWKKSGDKKVEMEGYDLARAERLAYKSADSDLLPRIAQQFNVGIYLKVDAIKQVKTEAALKDFLAKLSPSAASSHWADNGGRQRIAALLAKLGMDWNSVKEQLEPGKSLRLLNETALSEVEVTYRIAQIAFKPAGPQNPPPASPTPQSSTAHNPPPPPPSPPPPEPPKAENLAEWFPESHKPVNPFSDTPGGERNPYARRNQPAAAPAPQSNPLGFRNTVRHVGSASGRPEAITSFRIHPNDLDVGDIYCSKSGLAARIDEVLKSETGTRKFRVQESGERGGPVQENIVTIVISFDMLTIIGGPKLDRVQSNPALAPHSGAGRLWVGDQKSEAAS